MNRNPYEHYDNIPVILTRRELIKNHTQIAPHWHKNLELVYVLEGEIVIEHNLVSACIKKDNLYIINSNVIHSIESVSSKAIFYRLLIDTEFSQLKGFNLTSTIFESNSNSISIIGLYMDLIHQEQKNEFFGFDESIQSLCNLILIDLYRNHAQSSLEISPIISKKIKLVQAGTELIYKNFKSSISLDTIAHELSISKSYFCRIFKEVTDLTTHQYINSVRCKYAQSLLSSTDISIENCAIEAGFSSSAYFTRTYKSYIGYPPSHTNRI